MKKNLKFLDTFSKDFRYSTKVVVVDSDSNDGTKDIIKKYKNKNNFIINELDGLEGIYSNRIKRIAVSRNKCLEIIAKMNNKKKIIYIPLDLDLDLFKFVSIEKIKSPY